MNKLNLRNLELKTFTEQDVLDYCQLNSLNTDNIDFLFLGENELTDISGIKLFKNLEILDLSYNQIKNISIIQNFDKLEYLSIEGLNLESDQIKYIKSLKNLKTLSSRNGFKKHKILEELNNITVLTI